MGVHSVHSAYPLTTSCKRVSHSNVHTSWLRSGAWEYFHVLPEHYHPNENFPPNWKFINIRRMKPNDGQLFKQVAQWATIAHLNSACPEGKYGLACTAKVNSPLWPILKYLWDFMPAQVICIFHRDPIKNVRIMSWTMSSMAFFNNQGQITPNRLVRSGQNSNLSETLCLYRLSASLTKIRPIMNVLAGRHYFPIIMYEKFSSAQGREHWSEWSDPVGIGTHLRLYTCFWIPASLAKIRSNLNERMWRHHFPIISQWKLLVAMIATVLIKK